METSQKPSTKNAGAGTSGLEDIVATDSSICFIDGPRTRLIYRGYSINDLANQISYEEIAHLMLLKKLPNQAELKAFDQKLKSERALPAGFTERMASIPKSVHPMAVLRTLVSDLSFYDPQADSMDYDANLKKSIRMVAQFPALVANWHRIRTGQKPLESRSDLSHAENFLYLLTGQNPDPLSAKALDLYLVLLVDHELNASTFAARVTASTLSDYYSAMTSAVGALKGPLHGGANEQVIKMLLEIGDPSKVSAFLDRAFAEKKKIMGFGHRVYKVQDPRSPLLKDMSRKVCEKTGNAKLFQMLEMIEARVTEAKKLPSNVDFYSATLLYCVGIPVDLFTPMFVMSRIAGYSAHYLEQVSDNRLLRPRANYTGAMDLPFVPLSER
jgi:citrate synthase